MIDALSGRMFLRQPRLLTDYRLLGRSGLRVSPVSLGTMTFGPAWGSDPKEAGLIVDTYLAAGGNFIDTADLYGEGKSEQLVGEKIEGRRDSVVLATKYSMVRRKGDPNASGNHRKNMMAAVEASLRRLKTEYIDLYYLHAWDASTPPDEILRAFDDLIRQGKILYIGISDTPAWQVSRMQAIAELRGWTQFAALQIEYSLLERTVERDLIPMAREMGLGVIPWSPLGGGLLTGKYGSQPAVGSEGRASLLQAAGKVRERTLNIAAVVRTVADRHGRTPSEIAIAWTLQNPAVAAPIIGARTLAHLEGNLKALEVAFTEDDLTELNNASSIELGFPHDFLVAPHLHAVLGKRMTR